MRGVVQEYDAHRAAGLIRPDDDDSPLPFSHHNYENISMFDIGDQVEFEVKDDKAVNVEIYHPIDVFKDVYRCPTCRRYVLHRETTIKFSDGDWGYYEKRYCKKCNGLVNGLRGIPTGRFGDAYTEYKAGKMPPEEAREFEAALEDRTKISDFLNNKYQFH